MSTIGLTTFLTAQSSDTMGWARTHIDQAADGSVFIAHKLTHARGRQNRTWVWEPGQLALTILLKPVPEKILPRHSFNYLTMALACGIIDPFIKFGITLKWPNDFVYKNRKLGGMLLESIWKGETFKGIIFGFALNINNIFDSDHELFDRAISLSMIHKKTYNLSSLQTAILQNLNKWYSQWEISSYDHIFKHWKNLQRAPGQIITAHHSSGALIKGIIEDYIKPGYILLRDDKITFTLPLSSIQEILL